MVVVQISQSVAETRGAGRVEGDLDLVPALGNLKNDAADL